MAGSSVEKPREMIASTGYCYSGASSSHHLVTQLQSFDPNPEIYNMSAGMGMIGFSSKNHLHQEHGSGLWKGFFGKPSGNPSSSSSKEINEPTSSEFHHHDFSKQHDLTGISETTNETLMVSPDSASYHHNRLLAEIDPSLRSCVFPCEGNERPSQGLSLSLSSSNPSSIGLQSFEFRQQQQQHEDLRFGPSSSRSVNVQQMQGQHHHQSQIVRNSKYLGPAQELLNEFCNLGTKETDKSSSSKIKVQKSGEWQDEDAVKKQSLYSLDLLELQRRKTKLLQMLEQVDKRYKHYCDQMKAVVSSFEAVAGNGAATVYSAMASRAMSKHFRCLRDGILSQIKATKKAMGDKDTSTPGTIKGETPRLRILDQTLRQQRALQQMSLMESHPWRPQRGLPERSVSVLRAWLFEHFLHPYPSDVDKHILARQTGLSRSQVSNWFINARVRLWKPMVEEMYLEEQKEEEGIGDGGGAANIDDDNHDHGLMSTNQNPSRTKDQKPAHDQLVRIDSECLSSIINNTDKNASRKSKAAALQNHEQQNPSFGRPAGDSYGAMELDFSSYTHHHSSANYGGMSGGGGVSLTLGLHQHGGSGGVNLPFSPASVQSSLFYPRDHMEDCQTVQYSLLDSENQNLPYRNLMGAQLLHDLAG
ncbi:Homeobox protein BEL1 [Sesamum alatum]|uniref:Homeobox protein BEL1 n=1 Tax=Sesamum alatum TaxID=300844 RepID=A0AAE1YSH6_9LAMI|nr:Homeobox protein BEL1 [Sesamum alatum]